MIVETVSFLLSGKYRYQFSYRRMWIHNIVGKVVGISQPWDMAVSDSYILVITGR